eukprot:3991242-Prorocentrum_lima.AAC.1
MEGELRLLREMLFLANLRRPVVRSSFFETFADPLLACDLLDDRRRRRPRWRWRRFHGDLPAILQEEAAVG